MAYRKLTDVYGALLAGYGEFLRRKVNPPRRGAVKLNPEQAALASSLASNAQSYLAAGREPDVGIFRPAGKMVKPASHPGWLGALVQFGLTAQALIFKHQWENRHLGWDLSYSEGNSGSIRRNYKSSSLAKWLGGEQAAEAPWLYSHAEFPPPVQLTSRAMLYNDANYSWQLPQNKYDAYDSNPEGLVALPFMRRVALFQAHQDVYKGFNFTLGDQIHWGRGKWTHAPGDEARVWNYLYNARWLVWACETWRAASYEDDSWSVDPESLSGGRRELLEAWRRCCVGWAVGHHTRERIWRADRVAFRRMQPRIDPSANALYPWETIAALLMGHVGLPGDMDSGELVNVYRLCDWLENFTGDFSPAWRWPAGWYDAMGRQSAADLGASKAVKWSWATGKTVATVASAYCGGALAGFVGPAVEALAGKVSTTLGSVLTDTFATEIMESVTSSLDVLDRLGPALERLKSAVGVDEIIAEIEGLSANTQEGADALHFMSSVENADASWGYSDDLWGAIQTSQVATANMRRAAAGNGKI